MKLGLCGYEEVIKLTSYREQWVRVVMCRERIKSNQVPSITYCVCGWQGSTGDSEVGVKWVKCWGQNCSQVNANKCGK